MSVWVHPDADRLVARCFGPEADDRPDVLDLVRDASSLPRVDAPYCEVRRSRWRRLRFWLRGRLA